MARLSGVRVLLVEDANDVRDVLHFLLEGEGAVVISTGRGLEAIELALTGPYDVLLCDLGLPDIPGDMVIREVKANSPGALRVIIATGQGEPYIGQAKAAGADVVLTKPLLWSVLLDWMVSAGSAPQAA